MRGELSVWAAAGSLSEDDCFAVTCAPGWYLDDRGNDNDSDDSCEACPAGHSCDSNVKTACPAGEFQPQAGQSGCLPCPANSATGNAVDRAACRCLSGFHNDGTATTDSTETPCEAATCEDGEVSVDAQQPDAARCDCDRGLHGGGVHVAGNATFPDCFSCDDESRRGHPICVGLRNAALEAANAAEEDRAREERMLVGSIVAGSAALLVAGGVLLGCCARMRKRHARSVDHASASWRGGPGGNKQTGGNAHVEMGAVADAGSLYADTLGLENEGYQGGYSGTTRRFDDPNPKRADEGPVGKGAIAQTATAVATAKAQPAPGPVAGARAAAPVAVAKGRRFSSSDREEATGEPRLEATRRAADSPLTAARRHESIAVAEARRAGLGDGARPARRYSSKPAERRYSSAQL
jgi:hypothetical protein